MKRFQWRGLVVLAAMVAATVHAQDSGADWPKWRGPNGDGIAPAGAWNPAKLTGAAPAWKVNVGAGYSSMSIVGKHLFTMGNRNNNDVVSCLDAATGAEVWTHSYPCSKGSYDGPRATPVVVDGLVYTFSREGHIVCLKAADGSVVWEKHASKDFGAKNLTWGFASSALVLGDMLVLNAGLHGLALDRRTGAEIWSSGAGPGSYAVPVPYVLDGKKCLVVFSAKAIYGVDQAKGTERWSYPWETSYDVNAPDPIVVGRQVFFSSGYGKGCALLDIGGDAPKLIWQNKVMRSHFSSFVLVDGYLYGIDGNAGKGDLVCMEFATGAEKWRQNLGFGSLIAIGDKLVVLNESGAVFAAEINSAGYREVASARDVLKKTCWTPPAYSRGRLYCRNNGGDLVCLDLSK